MSYQPPNWQQPPLYTQPENYQQYPGIPPYPQPGQFPPMRPMQPPPKKKRTGLWIGLGVMLALLLYGSIAYNAVSKNARPLPTSVATATPTDAPTDTPVPTATLDTSIPTSTPEPTFATFGDGTFQVGKDIQPGTYRTRDVSPGCYFARLRGFGGTFGEIISNDMSDGLAIVTISPGDKGFQSQRCGTWTKDLSQVTTSKTFFDDGTYFIGTDITPGMYKSSGSQGCYYARLHGFGGTNDIIANNTTDSVAIITIASSDKGFESKRCGTWTRI